MPADDAFFSCAAGVRILPAAPRCDAMAIRVRCSAMQSAICAARATLQRTNRDAREATAQRAQRAPGHYAEALCARGALRFCDVHRQYAKDERAMPAAACVRAAALLFSKSVPSRFYAPRRVRDACADERLRFMCAVVMRYACPRVIFIYERCKQLLADDAMAAFFAKELAFRRACAVRAASAGAADAASCFMRITRCADDRAF